MWLFTFSAAPIVGSIAAIVGGSVGGLIAVVLVIVTVVVAIGILLKLKIKCEWPIISPIMQWLFPSIKLISSSAKHKPQDFSGQTA